MRMGRLLKLWRQTRDMTLHDMAKETGLSLPTLSRIERGNGIEAETLVKLMTWMMNTEGAGTISKSAARAR